MPRLLIFISCLLHLVQVVFGIVCSEPATDVIILIDDSGSLKPEQFQAELDFAAKMVAEFNLGPKNYQAGIFTFSSDAQSQVRLGEITDNVAFASRIKKIPYTGGFTYLGQSLKTVREGFRKAAGGRKNVRMALIIISDGETIDIEEIPDSVKLLQQNDIEVYAIVYGSNTNAKMARSLVSKSQDLFTVTNVFDLDSVVEKVKKAVCIDEIPVCGTYPQDIVFVLDESSSIKINQFTWLRYFVSRFVLDSKIGSQMAQVSIVAFADEVRNVFWLNDFEYKDDLANRIHTIQREGGMTYTNLALKHVRTKSFEKQHGGRKGAQKIVVVLTDGQSIIPEETFKEAKGLHEMGTNVFAIGVGQEVSRNELQKVASSNDYVFLVTSFDVLAEIEQDFRSKVCKNPSENH